jgi:uncharacterized membrane protein HdeD (DUF308 family)
MTSPQPQADWYPNPDGSGDERYWDGQRWTKDRRPKPEPAPSSAAAGSPDPAPAPPASAPPPSAPLPPAPAKAPPPPSPAPPSGPITPTAAQIINPKMMWPVMAVRGALAILFGFAVLLWPGLNIIVFTLLFAGWALLDGVSLLIYASRLTVSHADWRVWVPWLLAGLLGIGAAVITALWPGITLPVVAAAAAVLLIGVGVAEMMSAGRLRKMDLPGAVFMALAGLVRVGAGVWVLSQLHTGYTPLKLSLSAFVLGPLLLAVAFQVGRLSATASARSGE